MFKGPSANHFEASSAKADSEANNTDYIYEYGVTDFSVGLRVLKKK